MSNDEVIANFGNAAAAVRYCATLDVEERAAILKAIIEVLDAIGAGAKMAEGVRYLGMALRDLAFVDEAKRCARCGRTFIVTAAEMEFLHTKFSSNARPSHCKACRRVRREERIAYAQRTRPTEGTAGTEVR